MKRKGYIYERLFDLEFLKYAIRQAAKDKRKSPFRRSRKRYKPFVVYVLNNIDEFAMILRDMFMSGNIVLSPHKLVRIYDNSCCKERGIKVPKFFPDQCVHWALILALEEVLKKGMYRYCCGSVPNRGWKDAKIKMEKSIPNKKYRVVAKLDIHKFFDSVDTNILYKMFERKIKDKRMLRLIKLVLDNGGDGLPIGYYTSQWFSNFYLEGFDHFVKEKLRVPVYIRNVDDMVLIGTNKRKMHKAVRSIIEYLASIGLTLNEDWQVWKKGSRPIDFIGFKFYDDKTLLRDKLFYRILRRSRNIKKKQYITVHQARGLLSLLGWYKQIYGLNIYKRYVYPYAPKNKMRKVVSDYDRKTEEIYVKTIQQRQVACNS